MNKKFLVGSSLIFSALIGANGVDAAPAYMNDADTRQPSTSANMPNLAKHKYPRIIMAETQSFAGDLEKYSKYDIISAGGEVLRKIEKLQNANPGLVYFRGAQIAEYLEYVHASEHCVHGKGIPFENTTAATEGCNVFAGHWLYQAGTKTSQSLSATAKTLKVADAKRFTVGQYAVIYNAPAGSFNNAEHVKITARNTSTNTLTIQRGYKSLAKTHASGSIIAQHVVGQGGSALNWKFNVSTQGPKDKNGRTYVAAAMKFFRERHTKDWKNRATTVNVSGFLFDSDFHYLFKSKKADVNNDLVTDDGVSPSGVNWWGKGLDGFYANMRSTFPNKYVVTGHQLARGFDHVSGTQMEGWPQSNNFHSVVPEYNTLNSEFANYRYYTHFIANGPAASHVLTKTPTKIYPDGTGASTNKPYRFALGMGLLDNGYFGSQNSTAHPDVWYDEFAVYTDTSSSNYGEAVPRNATDESEIRKNSGWLGSPKGTYTRIYNTNAFSASASLVSPGTFDSNISGWTGTNVNISRDTGSKIDGAASLKAGSHTKYQKQLSGAQIKGPTANLSKNTWYTLVFSAKANNHRNIKANVGGYGERFYVGKTWRRYIMSFKAPASGNQRITFAIGEENIPVSFDSVYLFKGNANVFRRDFDNGIVVVNGTGQSTTINLGGTFQKIRGSQDPNFNNGQSLNSITLAAYDAAVLIRPAGSSGGGGTTPAPTPTPTPTPPPSGDIEVCGRPAFSFGADKGAFIWKNCTENKWVMYVSPGGGTVDYSGSIWSENGFSSVNRLSLESHDTLSQTGKIVKFRMRAWNSSADGVKVGVGANANTCFKITSPTNAKVYLGPNKVAMSGPFKLNSLTPCN